jgi:hypothetical protein
VRFSFSSLWFWRPRAVCRPYPDNEHLTFAALDDLRQFLDAVHRRLKAETGWGIPGTTTREVLDKMACRASRFAQDRLPYFESVDTIALATGRSHQTILRVILRGEVLGVLHRYNRPCTGGGGRCQRKFSNVYRFLPLPRPGTPEFEEHVRQTVTRFRSRVMALWTMITRRLQSGRRIKGRLRQYQIALGIPPERMNSLQIKPMKAPPADPSLHPGSGRQPRTGREWRHEESATPELRAAQQRWAATGNSASAKFNLWLTQMATGKWRRGPPGFERK